MSFWENLVKVVTKYGTSYLRGAGTTLLISLVGTVIGCLIGFAVGAVQTIPVSKRDNPAKRVLLRIVKAILYIYVEVFRGTPMIVQAVFIYYGSQVLFNIKMGMWTAAFFIVSINTGAYMAETVRGGILSRRSRSERGCEGHRHDACGRRCATSFCRRLCAISCRRSATT